MSIWHPDSGMTFAQFLQTNSFVEDISGNVRASGHGIEDAISDQTRSLVASNQELQSTLSDSFSSIENTISWGFDRVVGSLEDVQFSVDSLHADFNYSMGLLLEKIHTQNQMFSSLLGKLDAIHKTLESPTLTQAREYYIIGCERLSRGLLDKALEAFFKAEKENDTDFFTHFHIGNLYLYGIDEDCNLIDLEKAKEHFLLASRYAKAEVRIDPSFAKLAAEALLHASISVYAQLGEAKNQADEESRMKLLDEAAQLVEQATQLYPQLLEAQYHSAKYASLMGDETECISRLERAIVGDRKYAIKVDVDSAFAPVHSEVFSLLTELRQKKMDESSSKILRAEKVVARLDTWHVVESETLSRDYSDCKRMLLQAQEHAEHGTYFGFLDAIALADGLISPANKLIKRRINELEQEALNLVHDAENTSPQTDGYSEELTDLVSEVRQIISRVNEELDNSNYKSFAEAIDLAGVAKRKAISAKKKAREEDDEKRNQANKKREAEERQVRRDKASSEYAKSGGCIGAVLGTLSGCVSCYMAVDHRVTNPPDCGEPGSILVGLIVGVIVFAAVGGILGQFKR